MDNIEEDKLEQRAKKRECVSRAIIELHKKKDKTSLNRSQSIPIAGSGEFAAEERESTTVLFRSNSSSVSDQGCSPSLSDYRGNYL